MTDLDSLLRAVCERPGDDDLRLIAADCLEENGQDAPSDCIRRQVKYDPDHVSTFTRSSAFGDWRVDRKNGDAGGYMKGSWADWIAKDLPPILGMTVVCRRGFVASVRTTLALWLEHGQRVVEAHPVEEVVIVDKEPMTIPDQAGVWWESGGSFEEQGQLPHWLCAAAGWKVEFPYEWIMMNRFDSPALARSALGHAALMMMREKAGLPLWEWNPTKETT